jgi:hypothetical protein
MTMMMNDNARDGAQTAYSLGCVAACAHRVGVVAHNVRDARGVLHEACNRVGVIFSIPGGLVGWLLMLWWWVIAVMVLQCQCPFDLHWVQVDKKQHVLLGDSVFVHGGTHSLCWKLQRLMAAPCARGRLALWQRASTRTGQTALS